MARHSGDQWNQTHLPTAGPYIRNMIPKGTEKAVAFEVFRNARRICVAGLRGKRGVVSIIVHWVDRDDELMLDVGGLDSETRESLTWVRKPLAIGDERVLRVLVRVAPTRVRRELHSKLFEAKHEKVWLRTTAKKYGYKLVRSAHPAQSR